MQEMSSEPIPGIAQRADVDEWEQPAVDRWRQYYRRTDGASIYLLALSDKNKMTRVKPRDTSRYFEAGRRAQQYNLTKTTTRIEGPAVFVSLTYDPKRKTRQDAWREIGPEIQRTLDAVFAWRGRRMAKRYARTAYLWAIEEQPGTGYPHVHILFVGAKWLIPKQKLEALWSHGWVDVQRASSAPHAGRYVAKYIGKMRGWTELGYAMLYACRGRMYAISHHFRDYLHPVKPEVRWRLYAMFVPGRGLGLWLAERGKRDKFDWLPVSIDDWRMLAGPGCSLVDLRSGETVDEFGAAA